MKAPTRSNRPRKVQVISQIRFPNGQTSVLGKCQLSRPRAISINIVVSLVVLAAEGGCSSSPSFILESYYGISIINWRCLKGCLPTRSPQKKYIRQLPTSVEAEMPGQNKLFRPPSSQAIIAPFWDEFEYTYPWVKRIRRMRFLITQLVVDSRW